MYINATGKGTHMHAQVTKQIYIRFMILQCLSQCNMVKFTEFTEKSVALQNLKIETEMRINCQISGEQRSVDSIVIIFIAHDTLYSIHKNKKDLLDLSLMYVVCRLRPKYREKLSQFVEKGENPKNKQFPSSTY